MQTRTPVSPTRPGDLESAACASHGTGGQTDELTPVHDAFSRLYPNRSLAYTPVVTVMSLRREERVDAGRHAVQPNLQTCAAPDRPRSADRPPSV